MTHMPHPRSRFPFISDTSHGWLLVTPGELRSAGLSEADITPHSYRHVTGEIIALEEDCDAPTFLRIWEQKIGRPVEIEDGIDHLKFVRDWPRFGTKQIDGAGKGAAQ